MPANQPFTALCQAVARRQPPGRADLHVHTTASDGSYTPAEIIDLAQRSGLRAVAITDHDTLAGVAAAQGAARPQGRVEVIPGVEITAEYRERELHLLGYFVRCADEALHAALERLRSSRAERFWEMAARLRTCGVALEEDALRQQAATGTVGRRNLATLLVRANRAGSVREAFARYLGDNGRVVVPKRRLPVAEALGLVRGAGGVASWAHPSYDCTQQNLAELRALGLGAIEAEYPAYRAGRVRELRAAAAAAGLAVTGGSDCHGPERALGACSVTEAELEQLRRLAGR